jgi:hypothetical protein
MIHEDNFKVFIGLLPQAGYRFLDSGLGVSQRHHD